MVLFVHIGREISTRQPKENHIFYYERQLEFGWGLGHFTENRLTENHFTEMVI
jgi:hypothetical protein